MNKKKNLSKYQYLILELTQIEYIFTYMVKALILTSDKKWPSYIYGLKSFSMKGQRSSRITSLHVYVSGSDPWYPENSPMYSFRNLKRQT